MTPGKLEWRKSENFFHNIKLEACNNSVQLENKTFQSNTLEKLYLKERSFQLLDMIRGFVKMDVREKDQRVIETEQIDVQDTSASSYSDNGSLLVQCVERFFKNPQQNYEVPLQLLQEWFSNTSTQRKQELAKLFLSLLQEQGLDMDQILGQVLDYSDVSKTTGCVEANGLLTKKENLKIEPNLQDKNDLNEQYLEVRDPNKSSSSIKMMQWVESSNCGTPSLIGDSMVLKAFRGYRSVQVKGAASSDAFFETVAKRIQLSKTVNIDVPAGTEKGSEYMIQVVKGDGDVFVKEGGEVFTKNEGAMFNLTHCDDYSVNAEIAMVNSYQPVEGEKTTRSVGTSPFQEGSVITKCSSEPNIRIPDPRDVLVDAGSLRKSQSLPAMHLSEVPTLVPPLAPIEIARNKCSEPSPVVTTRTNEYSSPAGIQHTVISSVNSTPTTYKARTTFVEMSHSEFMNRQLLLNEKVNVRQAFRLGNQIVYVPELITCSTPHVEKPTPPLILHSDVKRSRNPVEIKLAMMGSDVLENVVVSQTSTSHTIHYTPSHSHIASAPSNPPQFNEKCSVVYVRENAPQPQPVLVATAPATTWQEEARKKPIIAYAKRKPNEPRDKGVIFGDNMKVLIAPNGILNSLHEQPKVTNSSSERTPSNLLATPGSGNHAARTTTSPNGGSEGVFVKRTPEEQNITKSPVVAVETAVTKPTLPKFNQTFVQNFQLQPVRAVEAISEAQPGDILRKTPNKVITTFNPVSQISAENAVVTEDNTPVTQDASVGDDEVVPVTHTLVQPTSGVIHSTLSTPLASVAMERPAQIKPLANAPQVGLLIYTQASPEESSPVQTLLLTTLPNGSAYCVRLPPNANLHSVTPSTAPQVETTTRPVVVQTVSHSTPVKKPDAITIAPPAESNKVALLKDLKEFENVFEETKLKFEKEKQLTVGEVREPVPVVNIDSAVQPSPPSLEAQPSSVVTAVPKFDCEKVLVGVKRKPEGEIPVVTRLYTTAKKPLIVVANYGQATPTQVQTRPVVTQVCSSSPPTAPQITNKSSKGKSRSGKNYPNPSKSPPTAKPQPKPQEDEKTQQKIFAILEEYAVQKEHSPDTNNRPAPRRRSNPPSASASKKKRSLLNPKAKDGSGDSEDGSFSEM